MNGGDKVIGPVEGVDRPVKLQVVRQQASGALEVLAVERLSVPFDDVAQYTVLRTRIRPSRWAMAMPPRPPPKRQRNSRRLVGAYERWGVTERGRGGVGGSIPIA